MKEQNFPYNKKPSHDGVSGELWNLRKQYNQTETHTHTHTHTHTQNMHLTAITSGEATQMLPSTRRELGLGTEVRTALLVLRVRTWLECPEGNLWELM